jgi:hypothetical protein
LALVEEVLGLAFDFTNRGKSDDSGFSGGWHEGTSWWMVKKRSETFRRREEGFEDLPLRRRRFAEREESGLGGWSGGDGVEFGVVLAERFGNFDFGAFEDVDELEGVDDGFALEVIVGDDEGVRRMFGDFADARDPRSEFFGGVEIVVALMGGDGGVVGEPGVVAAAMKTDVADGRGGLGRRSEIGRAHV